MTENDKQRQELYAEFTPQERAAARRLIKQNRWKWRAISVVWILFAAFVIYAYLQNKDRSQEGQQAHDAICALKGNIEHRVDNVDKLLKANEGIDVIDVDPGPKVFLISRALLVKSNSDDNQTLKTMRIVKCTVLERNPTKTVTK